MSGRYKFLLLFWGLLFALSTSVILVNMRDIVGGGSGLTPGVEVPDAGEDNGEAPDDGPQFWSIALATVTAVTSGGGFIVTTLFAMREDRRESALYQLQIDNLKKEIEHKELEIARMRREQAALKPKDKS